jgi:hypothetical protein
MDFLTSKSNIIVMFQAVDSIKLSTNIEFLGSVIKILHGWMFVIPAEYQLRLCLSKRIVRFMLPHKRLMFAYLSGW